MSFQLRLLNPWLRLTEKRFLARVRDPQKARNRLEKQAERFFRPVPGSNVQADTLRFDDRAVSGLWVSTGKLTRRKILLFIHGGAYIQGSPTTHCRLAAALARRVGARVFLPDYRLAPEHPYPAAADDVVTAYRGLLAAGHDPADIALGGDSAGGGLALALLHHICSGNLPGPACLFAFSPWTDLTLSGESLKTNERRDPLLPAARMAEIRDMYAAGAATTDPMLSPLFGSFSGAPPVLIQAGSTEILADDSRAMARVLLAAGVDVTLEIWPNTPHVWHLFQGLLPEADQALDKAADFLSAHLGG